MSASTDDPRVESIRKMLLWLSFECPLGGNPEDCPTHAVRRMAFSERRRWVAGLDDAECLRFFECHRRCEALKEAARREQGRPR